MVSYLSITLLLLSAIYGYSLDTKSFNVTKGDTKLLEKLKQPKNEGLLNNSELEKEAKNGQKLPEMSPERRSAYNSIRDRRTYFKRREDAARQRRPPPSRRVDPERDILEPQETVHRPQLTIPKQSVISADKKFYEFGLKLPKRISTKLSIVDGWGTTALPGDMENLVMPPGASRFPPKMSRLVTPTITAKPAPLALPLPLSLPDKTYPTRIEDNENNKRILSEMNKELQMSTTLSPVGTEVANRSTAVSTPLSIVNQSSSTSRSLTVKTPSSNQTTKTPSSTSTTTDVITTTPRIAHDQEIMSTTRPDGTHLLQSNDDILTTVGHRKSNDSPEASNTTMPDFLIPTTIGPLSTTVAHSPSPKARVASTAPPPTTEPAIVASTMPQFRIIVDRPKTNENEGRAFPTGFNDFHRDEEPEETVAPFNMELNKTVTTPRPSSNGTVLVTSTKETPLEESKEVTANASSTVSSKTEDDPDEQDTSPSGSHSVIISESSMGMEQHPVKAESLPTSTETGSNPPYIKVYITSAPPEDPDSPLNIFFGGSDPSNASDAGIVVSIVDENSVSPQSVGLAVYLLAVFGLVPLVLGFVFAAKFFLNRSRKSECGSDTSSTDAQPPSSRPRGSDLRKSPSSATTITLVHATRLPRVQQKYPSWELPRHQLTLLSILGHGNFGQVWKAELQEGPGSNTRLVAVKTVKEGATEKEQEEIIKELQIMQHTGHHPNVVQLLGCCTEKDPYYLVMEYVSNGKLLTFLREHRTQGNYYNFSNDTEALTSRDLTVFMYCVARGMEYLVSKRIIHRDLAARNVLVDQHKMCKIADFGMSRLAQEGDGEVYEERQHRGALPIRWMAPESLHYSVFTHKSDVWSFGILMWETVTLGSTPYPSLGAREVVQGVRTGLRLQRPSHVKTDLFRLVSRCWAQDPQARPNFTELRLHLADLLDGSCVDLDSFALDNRFHLQTRTKNRRSRNTGKGTVTLVGNGSFTVNSRILENQFSIV